MFSIMDRNMNFHQEKKVVQILNSNGIAGEKIFSIQRV